MTSNRAGGAGGLHIYASECGAGDRRMCIPTGTLEPLTALDTPGEDA